VAASGNRKQLSVDCPESSTTGAYRLSWKGASAAVQVMEVPAGGQAKLVYHGEDGATTLSGRAAGRYEYRFLQTEGAGLPPQVCQVEVAPPSWTLATALFAAGAVTSIATVVAVLRGHRAHGQGRLG
jgi:hypothetical protein